MAEDRGIVYCLINPRMPGLVKIGKTGNSVKTLRQRVAQLSNKTAVPVPYVPYHAVPVNNAKKAESLLHKVFEPYRCSDNREFYEIDPDQAKAAMKLTLVHGQSTGEVARAIERILRDWNKDSGPKQAKKNAVRKARPGGIKKSPSRRSPFRFHHIGIAVGETLVFYSDSSLKAIVANNHNQVRFEGEEYSLSGAADVIVVRKGLRPGVSGPRLWLYKGKTLEALALMGRANK